MCIQTSESLPWNVVVQTYATYRVIFFHPPQKKERKKKKKKKKKEVKYEKPRLGESMLTQIVLDTPKLA